MTDSSVRAVRLGGRVCNIAVDPADSFSDGLGEAAAALEPLHMLLAERIRPDALVLDIGANIGLSALIMAQVAPRIVAFEPSPSNGALLRRNLDTNGAQQVEVMAVALSDRPGTLRFFDTAFGPGAHVVGRDHMDGVTAPAIDVPSQSLDSLGLGPVCFIKLDVEGHEPEVLAGAAETIARDRPSILMEFNVWCLSAFAGHNPAAFAKSLFQAFRVSLLDASGRLLPLDRPAALLYEAIVRRGGYVDVMLEPLPGSRIPSVREMTWPSEALGR